MTEENTKLSDCFRRKLDIERATNAWFREMERMKSLCFKKIRITEKPPKNSLEYIIYKHLDEIKVMKNMVSRASEVNKAVLNSQIKEAENRISVVAADRNRKIIDEHSKLLIGEDGLFSVLGAWKLKKKLFPNCTDDRNAVNDVYGNLITDPCGIKTIMREEFTFRLRNRMIDKEFDEIKEFKEYLCNLRLKLTKSCDYIEWNIEDVDMVLRKLKLNKAKDPHGHVNEMYKHLGKDGKLSLLLMMNQIKKEIVVPMKMKLSDVTTLYKGKGSKQDVHNLRGVFQLPIVRNILDRLIYGEEYDEISKNMGCFQVGSQKGRNIRDHTLVLHAVINEARNMRINIDINLYDISQCFDALWLKETINDLYNSGVKNRNLNLLFEGNLETQMLVKTKFGNTERVTLEEMVMQGSVPGPILCSNQLSKLSNKTYVDGSVYMYMNKVPIPALVMVDDVLTIQVCGSVESIEMNAKCESFVKSKKLKFQVNKGKCQYIHIGSNECKSKYVANDKMICEVDSAKYLGDHISNRQEVLYEKRANQALMYVTNCIAMINEISLGYTYYSTAKTLYNAMFLNGTLINMETWTNFTEKRIQVFEKIEQYFLRKILNAHSKTAIETLYLELGIIPFRFHLYKRRILYYQFIMKRNEMELTKQIVNAQKLNQIHGDFYSQVAQNMNDLNIYEDDIGKNESKFKIFVKDRIEKVAFIFLMEKAKIHSKTNDKLYTNMKGSSYFSDQRFSTNLCNIVFMLRTRMYDVKNNFRNKYINENLKCPLCNEENDTQEHLFTCKVLREKCKDEIISSYEDIFLNDTDILLEVAKNAKQLIANRKILLDPSI